MFGPLGRASHAQNFIYVGSKHDCDIGQCYLIHAECIHVCTADRVYQSSLCWQGYTLKESFVLCIASDHNAGADPGF